MENPRLSKAFRTDNSVGCRWSVRYINRKVTKFAVIAKFCKFNKDRIIIIRFINHMETKFFLRLSQTWSSCDAMLRACL